MNDKERNQKVAKLSNNKFDKKFIQIAKKIVDEFAIEFSKEKKCKYLYKYLFFNTLKIKKL